MTRVFVDRKAGFCSGVKRALRGVRKAPEGRPARLVSYGELIHNPEASAELERSGIRIRHSLEEIRRDDYVLIRAHGVTPAEEAYLQKREIAYRDLTCPRVKQIHRIITEKLREGYRIIIFGDPQHPEVRGHLGYAGPSAVVLSSASEAQALQAGGRLLVLAQTTASAGLFESVVQILRSKFGDLSVMNTLCSTVLDRQEWIERYSRLAGAALIIGGKNSSNARKLCEIAALYGPAIWIATEGELDVPRLLEFPLLALTGGASTPDKTIREVVRRLESAGAQIEMC